MVLASMRELFRTDEGHAAWKNPATDAESRRLLGALVQPQPEKHLRLVFGADEEILLESLLRRRWVAWREKEDEASSGANFPAQHQPQAQPTTPASAPSAFQTAPQPSPPASSAAHWPPIKPAPEVSSEDIEASLDEFFRVIGSSK